MRLRLNKAVAVVGASALLLLAVPAVGMGEAGAAKVPTYTIGYEGPLSGGNQQLGSEHGVRRRSWPSIGPTPARRSASCRSSSR